MEYEHTNESHEQQEDRYEPRPLWQIRMARIGLVLFLFFVAYQILTIATGGL